MRQRTRRAPEVVSGRGVSERSHARNRMVFAVAIFLDRAACRPRPAPSLSKDFAHPLGTGPLSDLSTDGEPDPAEQATSASHVERVVQTLNHERNAPSWAHPAGHSLAPVKCPRTSRRAEIGRHLSASGKWAAPFGAKRNDQQTTDVQWSRRATPPEYSRRPDADMPNANDSEHARSNSLPHRSNHNVVDVKFQSLRRGEQGVGYPIERRLKRTETSKAVDDCPYRSRILGTDNDNTLPCLDGNRSSIEFAFQRCL